MLPEAFVLCSLPSNMAAEGGFDVLSHEATPLRQPSIGTTPILATSALLPNQRFCSASQCSGMLAQLVCAVRGQLRGSGPSLAAVTMLLSWDELHQRCLLTPTGARLQSEAAERSLGRGAPHVDAVLRLFDAEDESAVRVTLFRDAAAWSA